MNTIEFKQTQVTEQMMYKGKLPHGWRFVDEPGHGYFYIDAESQSKIPDFLRKRRYEEDCDWAIPVYFNPSLFSLSVVAKAESTLRNYYPKEYEKFTGKILERGESLCKDNGYYSILDNVGKWQSFTAYGDWCYDVPKGYVYLRLVRTESHQATYGLSMPQGEEMYALVTDEQYHQSNGFYDISELTPYKRDESFYTWSEYTEKTGKERHK
jgi:hypothetical protein